jgi:type I restriction enzyme S subunit
MSSDVAETTRPVSDLPDGWRPCKLGEVAVLGGGTTPSRSEETYWLDATVPWATPSDITSLPAGVSSISETESRVSDRALAECSLPLHPPGTVLMTSRATIGYTAINAVPMATNQGFITFRAGKSVDPAFLLHWLTASRSDLVAAAGGSTFKELSRGTAKLLPILLPPLDEQRRIADVLRSVDEAIARTNVAVKQASHAIDGMLQRLFIEGIGHAVFKDGHSTPIPASWDEKSLGELSAKPITYGVVQPGPNVADGIPFVRGGDFPNGRIDIAALRKIGKDVASQYRRTELKGGEIVVSLVGYPGACAIVPDELAGANVARQAALIRPCKEVVARYLYQFIRSPIGQGRLKKETIGSAQQVINLRDLKEVIVAVPPKHEQEQIAAILADLDAFVELETASLGKLTALKGSISADLLSGHVRVPA